MIYHLPHPQLFGIYKGFELLGHAAYTTAKANPYTTGALAVGAVAAYYLSTKENLKEDVLLTLSSFKFAVRQKVC